MKNTILHGEAMITESKVPQKAKVLEVNEDYLIIAPSETTGNHHVVDNAEGCTFYILDGVRYMRITETTHFKCSHAGRHDTLEIPPGDWLFGAQQEYDFFEQ